MLADIEAGKVGTVIVKDMSRLGRNYLQVGFYTEMSLYNTGTRTGLIAALEEMRGYLAADETELRELTDSAIVKLRRMNDAEYDALDLFPDFEKEDMDAE